ncbi:MAG: TIGR03084 family metal-binding protein [Acidimicrobiales bacterium]
MDVTQVRIDLIAEQDALDEALASLTDDEWALPSASERWSVADQIAHLAYFDTAAAVAITDPEEFRGLAAELLVHFGSDLEVDRATLGAYRELSPVDLVDSWREARARLAVASTTLADDDRVIWYGPSMGSKSFLTARLMECWAHGQDALDAVGRVRDESDRIQHIARLGFITRGWSYANRELQVPGTDVRVSLTAPSGAVWELGSPDAPESIVGAAADFCLVVTQRRHVDDTALVVEGDAARDWMLKAQAFAGPATDGPAASA